MEDHACWLKSCICCTNLWLVWKTCIIGSWERNEGSAGMWAEKWDKFAKGWVKLSEKQQLNIPASNISENIKAREYRVWECGSICQPNWDGKVECGVFVKFASTMTRVHGAVNRDCSVWVSHCVWLQRVFKNTTSSSLYLANCTWTSLIDKPQDFRRHIYHQQER